MPFQPGQSGNPGGRTKADREVVELARTAGVRAMGRLIELIESAEERVAAAAANSVLDRAYGKPTQPISGDDERDPIRLETPSVDALAKLSPDDRATIRGILTRAVA